MEKFNKLKIAFVVYFSVSMLVILFFICKYMGLRIDTAYLQEGFNVTERDLEIFKAAAKSKLTKKDLLRAGAERKENFVSEHNGSENYIHLHRVVAYFDSNGNIIKYGDWGPLPEAR